MSLVVKLTDRDGLPVDLQEYWDFMDPWIMFLRVEHNGKEILCENDRMEPEDATFFRDLSWVPDIIEKAYKLGVEDGKQE